MDYARTTSRDLSDPDARFQRDIMPLTFEFGRIARRFVRSQVDAEDLVQETILRAYRGFHGYRDGTNPRTWLYTILYNTWVSNYRALQRRPAELLTGEFTDRQVARGHQGSSSSSRSAEAEFLESCGDSEVAMALKTLPAEQRDAVYYADVEGLRYHEIATMMACPVGTVMSRVYRGRCRLRTVLGDNATRARAQTA
jgi:RNA polymerase sigma-70 factor (ECF subfamily)